MRTSVASVLVAATISAITIAASPLPYQVLQRRFMPQPSDVPVPPAGGASINPSNVRFLVPKSGAGSCAGKGFLNGPPDVRGVVAAGVDLSNDLTAQQLLGMGISFGRTTCPDATDLFVALRSGDPATFTDPDDGFYWIQRSADFGARETVKGLWSRDKPATIRNYQNFGNAYKAQELAEALEAKAREQALEQQRQAEQAVQAQVAARFAAFSKTNGVTRLVTAQQLTANPFVYQGQVVAIYGVFQQMNSATQGLFSVGEKSFVVSGIPTARFTQQRSMVLLAGRVLGNIEIKLPLLGATLVPNLSFVGSVFCQQQNCSEYIR